MKVDFHKTVTALTLPVAPNPPSSSCHAYSTANSSRTMFPYLPPFKISTLMQSLAFWTSPLHLLERNLKYHKLAVYNASCKPILSCVVIVHTKPLFPPENWLVPICKLRFTKRLLQFWPNFSNWIKSYRLHNVDCPRQRHLSRIVIAYLCEWWK